MIKISSITIPKNIFEVIFKNHNCIVVTLDSKIFVTNQDAIIIIDEHGLNITSKIGLISIKTKNYKITNLMNI